MKRFIDCQLAFLGIFVLSPLFLALCLVVFLNLGHPVFFKQARVGKDNRIFSMYKFRTMTNDKDGKGELLPDSQRLTPFGKWLRGTSLDELPEIWNILIGDMAIMGPRPLLVKDMVFYDDLYPTRKTIRPGLSGLAQVSGRNALDWNQKFILDERYVSRFSLFGDFCLFFRTLFCAFVKRDGVSEEGFATSEDYGDYLLRRHLVSPEFYEKKIGEASSLLQAFKNKKKKIIS